MEGVVQEDSQTEMAALGPESTRDPSSRAPAECCCGQRIRNLLFVAPDAVGGTIGQGPTSRSHPQPAQPRRQGQCLPRRSRFDAKWRNSDVIGLARAIYDDKAFEQMPTSGRPHGCGMAQTRRSLDIVAAPGACPRYRVVDLALGKE